MKCFATYNLYNAETLDPTLYPTNCFSELVTICPTPTLVDWTDPLNLSHPALGQSCYEGIITGAGNKTWSVIAWFPDNWVLSVWNGPTKSTATMKGLLSPTNPIETHPLTAYPTWWAVWTTSGTSTATLTVT